MLHRIGNSTGGPPLLNAGIQNRQGCCEKQRLNPNWEWNWELLRGFGEVFMLAFNPNLSVCNAVTQLTSSTSLLYGYEGLSLGI